MGTPNSFLPSFDLLPAPPLARPSEARGQCVQVKQSICGSRPPGARKGMERVEKIWREKAGNRNGGCQGKALQPDSLDAQRNSVGQAP